MKYKIDENEEGLEVSVDDVKNKKDTLLKAFQECQEGRCSCPTEEYKKLESMQIEQGEDSIQLRLKSKQGVKLDKSEINRCLEYTKERVKEFGEER